MSRAVTGKVHKRRVKTVLKRTKGFRGSRSKLYRVAKGAMFKALSYSYVGRKQRKRNMRSLWIARINAECRNAGIAYSKFMNGLKRAGIIIDRKNLANLAIEDLQTFKFLVEKAKQAL